jgi:hypothetical protein
LETEKFKLVDILYGILIPLAVALLIFVLALFVNVTGSYHVLGSGSTIAVILTTGFAQMIILGIPLVAGLLWNKWAGGAAGFVMGGIYYAADAGYYNGVYGSLGIFKYNFFGDVSMISYIVMAILIGYIAGALNNKSTSFLRMLGAGMTAAIITAIIQAYLNVTIALSPARAMGIGEWKNTSILGVAGIYGFVLAFVPSIALGVIVPIVAKVMTWYGLQPMRH